MSARRVAFGVLAATAASFACFTVAVALLDPGLRLSRTGVQLSIEEEAGVLGSLVNYQRIYEDFYASGGNPALLDVFPASREVKHQIFRDIGFVREAGLVLVQDLAMATLVRVSRTGPQAAEAVTYEEWNHLFQRAEDRVPASQLKGMGQGFRYRLEREGKRWIVTGWELEEVPRPPDDGRRKW